MALTPARSEFALRAAVALVLALMIHAVAWLMLAGIRVLLPRPATAPPVIEAALLPPAQAPVVLPTRRAVARTAPSVRRGAAPLQAVRTDIARPTGAPARAGVTAAPAPSVSTSTPPAAAEQTPAAGSPPSTPEPAPAASASSAPAPEPALEQPPPQPAAQSAAARPAVPVVLPRSARLVYASYATVRAGGFVLPVRGRTTTRWQFKDGRYQLNLNIDVVNFSESSQGQFDPDYGLEPERYSEARPHRPVSTTQFDWANRRISFTEQPRQEKAEPGTQDRLSVQFQLSVLRQVYPDLFVRGTVVPITLAGTRDVSHWTFTVTGDDSVDSGIGRLPAVRVLSNRSTGSGDESLEVWISEKLDWFPARIRMVDKNRNVLDFVLDEATID